MKLSKDKSSKIEGKLKTASKNLKKISAHAVKTLDRLEKKEITLNQAKVAQRLIADAIRAELGAAMLDNQVLTLNECKVITIESK
jgi:hypothetical protein